MSAWQSESDQIQTALDTHLENRSRVNKFILAVTLAMRAPGPLLPPPSPISRPYLAHISPISRPYLKHARP